MRAPLAKAGLALLFPAIAFFFFADLFTGDRLLLARDALADNVPMRLFEAHALRAGEFPFWCPFFGPGKPYFADTTGSLYPAAFLYAVLSPANALRLDWLVHVALAGGAFYVLLRQFAFSRPVSIACAIGFMLSSWLFVRAEFLPAFEAAAWIPLPLALLVRFDRGLAPTSGAGRAIWRQWPLVAALAGVFTMAFLANYPEFLLYPLAASVLYVLGTGRRAAQNAVFLAIAGVIAILIVSPQLGPMLEFLPYTERSGTFDARFSMASFGLPHLATMVFPFAGGRPGYPDAIWARGIYEYWAIACFVGALPVFAAPFGLLSLTDRVKGADHRIRRRAVVLGGALVVLGLLLSAGENLPVYGWLFGHLPGMNRFRFPSKFLVLVVMGTLLLAAGGLQAILDRSPGRNLLRMRRLFLVEVALLAALGAWVFYAQHDPAAIRDLFHAPSEFPAARFAEAARQLVYDVLFALAAIASIGMALYARGSLMRGFSVALPVLVFVNLTVVSRQLYPAAPASTVDLDTPIANAAVMGDPSFRAYSQFASGQQWSYGNSDPSAFRWSREAGVGSWWIADGIHQSWQGSFKLQRYLEFLAAMGQTAQGNALADLLSVRWVVAGASDARGIFTSGASREYRVLERPTAMPRVRLVSRWTEWRVSPEAAVARLASNPPAAGDAYVEPVALSAGQPVTSTVPQPDAAAAPTGTLSTPRFSTNRIEVRTQTASTNLLVVGDTWYPGWTATIDGRDAPIHRVNALFRGVFVPAGVHEVELSYRPRRLTLLLALSLTGVLLALIPLFAAFLLRRRPHRTLEPLNP
jgi:hypothetical protein